MGYKHVGGLVWLTTCGHVRKDPSFLEINLRGHLTLLTWPYYLARFAENAVTHKVNTYMEALAAADEKEFFPEQPQEDEENFDDEKAAGLREREFEDYDDPDDWDEERDFDHEFPLSELPTLAATR